MLALRLARMIVSTGPCSCGNETKSAQRVHLEELRIVPHEPTVQLDQHLIARLLHCHLLPVEHHSFRLNLYLTCYFQNLTCSNNRAL